MTRCGVRPKTPEANRKSDLMCDAVAGFDRCPKHDRVPNVLVEHVRRGIRDLRLVAAEGVVKARKRARTKEGERRCRGFKGAKALEEDAVFFGLLNKFSFDKGGLTEEGAKNLQESGPCADDRRNRFGRVGGTEPFTLVRVCVKADRCEGGLCSKNRFCEEKKKDP